MVKSNTLTVQEVEKIVDMTVGYLKDWTQSEIISMMKNSFRNNTPFVAKLKNDRFIIGCHLIKRNQNGSWRLDHYLGDYSHNFSNKLSAICYSTMYQTGKIEKASQILLQDNVVSRLEIKSEQFHYRYQQASAKKDNIKTELFFTRYLETKYRLSETKTLLEKSLKSAKYIKF